MAKNGNSRHAAERGNALVLVLLAIVFFAALSYVVAQGGNSTGQINEKDEQMAAFARLTQFPGIVKATLDKMLHSGVDISQLDFGRAAKGDAAVFAHVSYQNPPLSTGASNDWAFKGVTAAGEGWFISGIGTDGAGGKDVFAYLDNISQQACEQVNKALGLPAGPMIEATVVDLSEPGAAGAVAGNNAWSFNIHATPKAQEAACVRNGNKQDGTPDYTYYHVIVAK